MKNTIFSIFLFICQHVEAQEVSGLYTGTLYNDTTKMTQQYQLALSEYRGKITGWSYTTFVVNDTFYYGIRTIKGYKKDGQLVVEDDKFIVNNFPESPAKGVKRVIIVPLTEMDTLNTLNGRWQTNRTKQYYAVSGSVKAKRDNDSSQSALIGHLKELGIIGGNNQVAQVKVKTSGGDHKVKVAPLPKSAAPGTVAPLSPAERKNRVLSSLQIASDSLVLQFYDNGVVDGDVISVYIDGVLVIASQKLTDRPIKKTISIAPEQSSIEIKLVAENLGTLPPNTGLLVIQDGALRHNINFSADLQNNASIILRKKN